MRSGSSPVAPGCRRCAPPRTPPSSSSRASPRSARSRRSFSRNPHATFARIAAELHPETRVPPGIAATARVRAGRNHRRRRDRRCSSASSNRGATLARGVVLGPHCIVGERARLGEERAPGRARHAGRAGVTSGRVASCIRARSSARTASATPARARRWVKVPQLGGVRVGDDVEIGANTTIDRGALGDTVHRRRREARQPDPDRAQRRASARTPPSPRCTGIAGSAKIGRRCMIGGGAGIVGHITIGDDVVITGHGDGHAIDHGSGALLERVPGARRRARGGASSAASSGSIRWPRGSPRWKAIRRRARPNRKKTMTEKPIPNVYADIYRDPQVPAASLSVPARGPRDRVRAGRDDPRASRTSRSTNRSSTATFPDAR